MYQGHLNDGSSIQKHSAGGLYPYIVFARQSGPALVYCVLTPEGEEFPVGLYDTAVQLATNMKEISAEIKRLAH